MEIVYAQVKDGIVVNTIVLNDSRLIDLFSADCDEVVNITALDQRPSIGWAYDGAEFLPPA